MRVAAFVYSVVLSAALISPQSMAGPTSTSSCTTTTDRDDKGFSGLADYYHHKFYGKKTASGAVLQKHLFTAAHRTLPFGTKVKVTSKRSGKSCVVTINDRGPFTKGKVIDLSHAAADHLGVIEDGTSRVACTVLADDED